MSVLKYSQRQLKYEERNTCVIARKIKASNFQLRVKKKKKTTLYLYKKGICYFKCTGRGITCRVPRETAYTVSQKENESSSETKLKSWKISL